MTDDQLREHLHARGWSLDKIDVAMIREGAAAIQPAIDVERMLRETVPGGTSCDPQAICDDIRAWFAANQAEEAASTMQVVAWRKTLRFQSGRVEYSFTWQKEHADDWARLGKPLEPMVMQADALAAIKAARSQALEEAAALYGEGDVAAPVGNSEWGETRQGGWIDGTWAYRDAIRRLGEEAGKP